MGTPTQHLSIYQTRAAVCPTGSGPVYLNNLRLAIGEASLAFAAYQLN
jgi:hypothetical protein